jgi:hypothetical protein
LQRLSRCRNAKRAFQGKNFWLRALAETESDWRRGKAWQVSLGESFAAKSPMSLEATLLLLWQGHPLASSQDESA